MELTARKYQAPPRTAIEVFNMLPEGTLAEVINNIIYMSPAPSFQHQDILGDLYTSINTYIKKNSLGKCLFAPLDVFLDNENAFQPDIVYISNGNMNIVQEGKVKGAPYLIIEALSPGNKKLDLEDKKLVYEKCGVKEYFIVDPISKEVISYILENNKFVKKESKNGKVKSGLLSKTFLF